MAITLPDIDYEVGASVQYRGNRHVSRMGENVSVRSEVGPNQGKQVWRNVRWSGLTSEEKDEFKAAFLASNGVYAISWTPPVEDTPILVVVPEDTEPEYTQVGYENWTVAVSFEQVFDEE